MQDSSFVQLFPQQASTFAWQVDALFGYLILVSLVFSVPIILALFYFSIRYREREKYAVPKEIHGSMVLETLWSIIPFFVSMPISFLEAAGFSFCGFNDHYFSDESIALFFSLPLK